MEREISNNVKTVDSATSFQSIEKSLAVDKTTFHFDNVNLKMKKIG